MSTMYTSLINKLLFRQNTNISKILYQQSRGFFRILTDIANRPDEERIKLLGPDRSCAEWLVRCGATIRWKGTDKWQTDYNTLPSGKSSHKYEIEGIDANEASITTVGFDHFDGCKNIRQVRLRHLAYFNDEDLHTLVEKLKMSLEKLELVSCDISDDGLALLARLKLLKSLLLQDLPEVRNRDECYKLLTQALPACDIDYVDLKLKK